MGLSEENVPEYGIGVDALQMLNTFFQKRGIAIHLSDLRLWGTLLPTAWLVRFWAAKKWSDHADPIAGLMRCRVVYGWQNRSVRSNAENTWLWKRQVREYRLWKGGGDKLNEWNQTPAHELIEQPDWEWPICLTVSIRKSSNQRNMTRISGAWCKNV